MAKGPEDHFRASDLHFREVFTFGADLGERALIRRSLTG
jgi:hypothetical protein